MSTFITPASIREASPLSAQPARARPAALFLALTVAAGVAEAGDFSLGFGAGATHGRGRCVDSMPCDRSSAAAKLSGNWRFDERLDAQVVYLGGNSFKGGDTTPLDTEFGGRFEVEGIGLTVGWRWPLATDWSLTARAGVAAVRTRFEYADDAVRTARKSTAQPLAGLRLAWQATPQFGIGLDYDLTRLKVHSTRGSLQILGLAAQISY